MKPAEESIKKLKIWLRSNRLEGPDPYDALLNPFLARLGNWRNWVGRVIIQILRWSPINLRRVLRIQPMLDAKALGLLGHGYFLLWDCCHRMDDWRNAFRCLSLLENTALSGFSGRCWGHPFPYRSRRGYIPANRPSIVSTFYAAQAFLDAYERTGEERYMRTARSACDFILNDLERIERGRTFCFSYHAEGRLAIHNAHLLALQLLARVDRVSQKSEFRDIVKTGLQYTVEDQNPDGSWFYDGPDSPFRTQSFIDGFHTGFVLESLFDIARDTALDLSRPIERGMQFYVKNLLRANGQPLRMVSKRWPVDLRDCAQAIIVLSKIPSRFAHESLLTRTLNWTISNMQSPRGYFYYARYRRWVTPVPYIRFQAWMLAALATATVSREIFHGTEHSQ